MAIYSYIAIQQDGKEKKGIIDATSIAAARGIIRRQKLLKSLKEDKEKRERVLFPYLALPRPSSKYCPFCLTFYKHISLKKALTEIRNDVIEGARLKEMLGMGIIRVLFFLYLL